MATVRLDAENVFNLPSGKSICCWWLPVLGNGPDLDFLRYNFPVFEEKQTVRLNCSTNAKSRYTKLLGFSICNRNHCYNFHYDKLRIEAGHLTSIKSSNIWPSVKIFWLCEWFSRLLSQEKSCTYGGQNGGSDAQADGQRARSFDVFAMFVANSEDDQDQREGGEELDAETLRRRQGFVHFRHAQSVVELARRQSLQIYKYTYR